MRRLVLLTYFYVVDAFLSSPCNEFQIIRSIGTARWGSLKDIGEMRVKEIKDELHEKAIDFSDCFDKESLVRRLKEAREGKVAPSEATSEEDPSSLRDTNGKVQSQSSISDTAKKDSTAAIDRDSILKELRSLRVKELRTELAERGLRWAGLLEKEDLVQAVLRARIDAASFSSTGSIMPGKVGLLTGPQVTEEINFAESPMLLDVYATWCGPCQLMSPILEQSAADMMGIRFAKMDSDAHPAESSSLKVQGLPTLILFNKGKEIDRVEGALMKDQLKEWIESHGFK